MTDSQKKAEENNKNEKETDAKQQRKGGVDDIAVDKEAVDNLSKNIDIDKNQIEGIGDISKYIEQKKKKEGIAKPQFTRILSVDGKNLTKVENIYSVVPHKKGDHKLVFFRDTMPNTLKVDPKQRKKGTTYTKGGHDVYDVHVDFMEHPTLRGHDGKPLTVWIIDKPEDLTQQIAAIKTGAGRGTNFKEPVIINPNQEKTTDTENKNSEQKNEQATKEKAEKEKAEKEKAEKEKLEKEKAEREKAEKEKAEKEKAEREKAEKEKTEKEKLEKEKAEKEKLQKEKAEKERAEKEKAEKEKLEKEKAEKEKLEKEKLEKEKAEEEKLQKEKLEKEKAEEEKLQKEKAEKERAEKEKAEKEKAEKEKAEKEKAEKEKAEKEKAEKEKLQKEKTDREKLQKEKAYREKAEKERAEKEKVTNHTEQKTEQDHNAETSSETSKETPNEEQTNTDSMPLIDLDAISLDKEDDQSGDTLSQKPKSKPKEYPQDNKKKTAHFDLEADSAQQKTKSTRSHKNDTNNTENKKTTNPFNNTKLYIALGGFVLLLVVFIVIIRIAFSGGGENDAVDLVPNEEMAQEDGQEGSDNDGSNDSGQNNGNNQENQQEQENQGGNNQPNNDSSGQFTFGELVEKLQAQQDEARRALNRAKTLGNNEAIKFATAALLKATDTLDKIDKRPNYTASQAQDGAERIDYYIQQADQLIQ